MSSRSLAGGFGLAVVLLGCAAASLGARADRAGADTFACDVVSVHDGDGPIRCASGERIRLAGIAARELDGTCRPGHPCPAASAEAARDELQRLAVGRLACRQVGTSYGRTVAWCSTPAGVDLSCAMVRSGTVLRWIRHDPDRRLARCGARQVRR